MSYYGVFKIVFRAQQKTLFSPKVDEIFRRIERNVYTHTPDYQPLWFIDYLVSYPLILAGL